MLFCPTHFRLYVVESKYVGKNFLNAKKIEKHIDKCRWLLTQQLQKLAASTTEGLSMFNVQIGTILSDLGGGKGLINICLHVTPFFK